MDVGDHQHLARRLERPALGPGHDRGRVTHAQRLRARPLHHHQVGVGSGQRPTTGGAIATPATAGTAGRRPGREPRLSCPIREARGAGRRAPAGGPPPSAGPPPAAAPPPRRTARPPGPRSRRVAAVGVPSVGHHRPSSPGVRHRSPSPTASVTPDHTAAGHLVHRPGAVDHRPRCRRLGSARRSVAVGDPLLERVALGLEAIAARAATTAGAPPPPGTSTTTFRSASIPPVAQPPSSAAAPGGEAAAVPW